MNNSNFFLQDYCDEGFVQSVIPVLSTAYVLKDNNLLTKAYKAFKSDFDALAEPLGRQTIGRSQIIPKTDNNLFMDAYKDISFTIGIDLPVLIKSVGRENRGTIFIVGEDPLREKLEDIDVILSTPFATHRSEYRKRTGRLYWEISQWILNNGWNIYYTDINKIWIKKKGATNKLKIPTDLWVRFCNCLHNEIKTFNPNLIISFGKPAEIALRQMNQFDVKQISYPHPSWRSNWKKKYSLKEPASNPVLLDIMKRELNNNLIKNWV